MKEPDPPTAELRALYDRAIPHMRRNGFRSDENWTRRVNLGELHWGKWPLNNVWLGVSVEDQKRADERRDPMQALAEIGWLTWVSYEPAIGPVDWTSWEFIRWLVSGGESGPRSSHPEWHRAARDFCANNSIPFLFKQWGSWAPSTPEEAAGNPRSGWVALSGNRPAKAAELYPDAGAAFVANVGKKAAGRLLDGIEHNGFPEARR